VVTAKGKKIQWHQKLTVQEILNTLGYTFPLILVRVDDRVVKRAEWDSFLVPDGAVVEVQPIVAGG
jgi:thiamine biosynthesis protein ThiS